MAYRRTQVAGAWRHAARAELVCGGQGALAGID